MIHAESRPVMHGNRGGAQSRRRGKANFRTCSERCTSMLLSSSSTMDASFPCLLCFIASISSTSARPPLWAAQSVKWFELKRPQSITHAPPLTLHAARIPHDHSRLVMNTGTANCCCYAKPSCPQQAHSARAACCKQEQLPSPMPLQHTIPLQA